MLREKLLHFLIIILFITNSAICKAKNISVRQCEKLPSCGHIHNISYPFRLKDQPENCGEPKYQLVCENNKPSIHFLGVKYHVQSINNNNLTIRLVDALVQTDNCSSLPLASVKTNTGDQTFFNNKLQRVVKNQTFYSKYYNQNQKIIFLSCERPLTNSSSLFIDTKPCVNGSVQVAAERKSRNNNYYYSYVTSDEAKISDIDETCSVDLVTMSANPINCGSKNCSYSKVHDLIAYGFELSWNVIACEKYCNGRGICYLEDGGNVIVDCGGHCGFGCRALWIVSTVVPWIFIVTLFGIPLRFIIGLLIFSGFLIYKWRRRHLSMYDLVEEFLQSQNNLRPVNYSFSDIKKMTKGFKDKLGEGGYGSVYKGTIRSGRDVAVKVLGKSKGNGQEFINEVATIGRIHHVNVVRLIGFCAERSKRALVYEFMPNGSLEKHIFPREGHASLGHDKMFEISVGVARGIEYLHRGCNMRILHFDIKPHNILLDENFTPKVSDFGLARLYPTDRHSIVLLTAARGTIGYMAPELFYRNIGSVSHKADVYSFGMLLLEMTGKKRMPGCANNPEDSSQTYFHSWVYDQVSEGNNLGIDGISADETMIVRKMVIIGLWCIQTRPNDRPSMNRVIEMLESRVESLEMPPKPSLYIEHEINPISIPVSSSTQSEDSTESSSLILNAN